MPKNNRDLLGILNNTGLQVKDNTLYQVLKGLIDIVAPADRSDEFARLNAHNLFTADQEIVGNPVDSPSLIFNDGTGNSFWAINMEFGTFKIGEADANGEIPSNLQTITLYGALFNYATELRGSLLTTTINLTGGQIKFPVAQAASADPNTLDDYEEGTTLVQDASGAGLGNLGGLSYIKVGDAVIARGQYLYPVTASGLPNFVNGIPFPTSGNAAFALGYFATTPAIPSARLWIQPGGANMQIVVNGGAVTNAQLTGSNIVFAGAYTP